MKALFASAGRVASALRLKTAVMRLILVFDANIQECRRCSIDQIQWLGEEGNANSSPESATQAKSSLHQRSHCLAKRYYATTLGDGGKYFFNHFVWPLQAQVASI